MNTVSSLRSRCLQFFAWRWYIKIIKEVPHDAAWNESALGRCELQYDEILKETVINQQEKMLFLERVIITRY